MQQRLHAMDSPRLPTRPRPDRRSNVTVRFHREGGEAQRLALGAAQARSGLAAVACGKRDPAPLMWARRTRWRGNDVTSLLPSVVESSRPRACSRTSPLFGPERLRLQETLAPQAASPLKGARASSLLQSVSASGWRRFSTRDDATLRRWGRWIRPPSQPDPPRGCGRCL